MKKVVVTSSLNARFYKAHGWTLAILQPYLMRGGFVDTQFSHHQDKEEDAYFILNPGSVLDMDRLFDNEVGEVKRTFNDHPSDDDKSWLKRFNW